MDLAFVDSPATTATTRLALSDEPAGRFVNLEDVEFGAPAVLGDAGGTDREYDYRRVEVAVWVVGTRAVAAAFQSALAREVLRDDNYLAFRYDNSSEWRWLHTYRSTPGEVQLSAATTSGGEVAWLVTVSLVADPFALGAQVTQSQSVVNNPDPAAGTYPLGYVLAPILGDAPAPAVVELGTVFGSRHQPVVAIAAYDSTLVPAPELTYWQADAWNLAAPSSVVLDGAASGGSVVTATLTATSATILTGTVKPTHAGRYRLFARVKASIPAAGSVFLTAAGTALSKAADPVEIVDGDEGARLVDLGEFAWPKGNMPLDADYSMQSATVVLSSYSTATGSPTVSIDYVVAIPVDLFETVGSTLLRFTASTPVGPDNANTALSVIDGEKERTTFKVGNYHSLGPVDQGVGGYPMVWPGAANRVFRLLNRRSDTGFNDAVTTLGAVTIKYRPRYLYLAGS